MFVPTPYSILNDPDDGEDVFETIFPQYIDPGDPSLGEYPYWEEKRMAMWARFHDTGLGNPDKEYWERCVSAKAAEIDARYLIKFRVFSEYKARLAANTGDADLTDSEIESSSVNKLFDPPEVTVANADATHFLADQNTTVYNQKTKSGLEPATVTEYMDAVKNPFEELAREFDKLFYWGI